MTAKKPHTPKIDMAPAYDASKVEDGIYARWEKSGYFNPDKLPAAAGALAGRPGGKKRKPFVIMMPPPNATGVLHIGHALFLSLEDLITRFERMRGKAALWLPGTDHAAIATQTKVEKLIAAEGKRRQDLGREAFLERVDAYVEESRDIIRNQIRKMGSSCDWSRECFTLDKPRSAAVREIFVRMFEDGLAYRGERVVNWCPRCASTLADDEVEYKEQDAKLYHLKYGPYVVATTRPETKLGDTGLAANPSDPRYKDKIGTSFELNWGPGTKPLIIRFIGDREVDQDFGSGLVGVTPAHSAVDSRMADKSELPYIKVIGEDGRMTAAAGKYAGLTVLEAREAFVKDLEAQGLIVKIEDIKNNLSVCYRCGTAIEPLTSLQWFINVKKKIPGRGQTLKELSLQAVKSGAIEIVPDRFAKIYYHWMESLRDWCVSRQIWYGHRIPAWYCECGEVIVSRTTPKKCPKCGSKELRQDSDVFDTWFSSGIWTFSTLGWPASAKASTSAKATADKSAGRPKKTGDLARFHPTQVLETGYDILPFWVARMILMTTYAMKEVPFEKVYLHGLVRDEQGRKLSKSLGNGIDPLEVSAKYGTDAVRLSLVLGSAPGADSRIWDEKIAGFRNFTNKLWNVSRFVLSSVSKPTRVKTRPTPKTLADRWILSRLDAVTAETTSRLAALEFSAAGEGLRDFTWTEFADWYLEIAKVQMQDPRLRASTEKVLLHALETVLKLWHPFMPFVTEAIWDKWQNHGRKKFLMVEKWPASAKASAGRPANRRQDQRPAVPASDGGRCPESDASGFAGRRTCRGGCRCSGPVSDFGVFQEVVTAIRNLRSEYRVEPAKRIDATVIAGAKAKMLKEMLPALKSLARLENVVIVAKGAKPENSAAAVAAGVEIALPLSGLVDAAKERERLTREKANLENYIRGLEAKLANAAFTAKAPPAVVEQSRSSLREKKEELQKIDGSLSNLA